MSDAVGAVASGFEAGFKYFGFSKLEKISKAVGLANDGGEVLTGDDKAKIAAGIVAGLVAAAVIGPTLPLVAATDLVASGILAVPGATIATTEAQAIASALVGSLLEYDANGLATNLYSAVVKQIRQATAAIGGSSEFGNTQLSADGNLDSASDQPSNIVIASPDGEGGVNQLQIHIPTLGNQSTSLFTLGSGEGTDQLDASSSHSYVNGAQITFIGNDDQEHTATVRYETDVSYVVDTSSGYLAVGKYNVTSYTAPTDNNSTVNEYQDFNNGDVSVGNEFHFDKGYDVNTFLNNEGEERDVYSGNGDFVGQRFTYSDGSYYKDYSNNNGSFETDYYSPSNQITGKDIERKNDTSVLVTYDASGTPMFNIYSGPEGSGNVVGGNVSQGSGSGNVPFPSYTPPSSSSTGTSTGGGATNPSSGSGIISLTGQQLSSQVSSPFIYTAESSTYLPAAPVLPDTSAFLSPNSAQYHVIKPAK